MFSAVLGVGENDVFGFSAVSSLLVQPEGSSGGEEEDTQRDPHSCSCVPRPVRDRLTWDTWRDCGKQRGCQGYQVCINILYILCMVVPWLLHYNGRTVS